MTQRIIYLHGFASSPRSQKGRFLADRLAAHGLMLHRPDFNQPDFSTLTVSRMMDQLESEIASLLPGPIVLIGSSLGGFVALHAAERSTLGDRKARAEHRVEGLILLAPALEFAANRLRNLGEGGLSRWRETNRLEVFHYGDQEIRGVHYALYEDAIQFNSFATAVEIPTLIFQGRFDESVDPSASQRFAHERPWVKLYLLEDDHQLLGSLDFIYHEIERFLGLG